jgi:hypothetical protein
MAGEMQAAHVEEFGQALKRPGIGSLPADGNMQWPLSPVRQG